MAWTTETVRELSSYGYRERGIIKQVMEFYGVVAATDAEGNPSRFFFPFSQDKRTVSGYKTRSTTEKHDMFVVGKAGTVFGLEHFTSGGRRIIITEGEYDALAIQTANFLNYGKFYPVVSMGGSDQVNYLLKERETLRKFDEILLWFDSDEAGQAAVPAAARILGYEKVKVITTDFKDANDMLLGGESLKVQAKAINSAVFDAKPYNPAGIVHGEDTWDIYKAHKNRPFVPWAPFLERLNELTFGRSLGSITMIAAGTGVGKTTFLREDVLHILDTTDAKIGVCFLEEDVGESVAGLIALRCSKRTNLPGVELTDEEEHAAWLSTLGTGRIMLLDHQGSVSDGSLLDKLEYLAVSGCTYIYLDHITIAISETKGESLNAAQDAFMSGLLRLVKRSPVWIGVVSHLRKVGVGDTSFEEGGVISEDDLKGSGSLKQVSFQTIALSRNKQSEDSAARQVTTIWLLKDRRTGNTGPAGAYRFNGETGRLTRSLSGEARAMIRKSGGQTTVIEEMERGLLA